MIVALLLVTFIGCILFFRYDSGITRVSHIIYSLFISAIPLLGQIIAFFGFIFLFVSVSESSSENKIIKFLNKELF